MFLKPLSPEAGRSQSWQRSQTAWSFRTQHVTSFQLQFLASELDSLSFSEARSYSCQRYGICIFKCLIYSIPQRIPWHAPHARPLFLAPLGGRASPASSSRGPHARVPTWPQLAEGKTGAQPGAGWHPRPRRRESAPRPLKQYIQSLGRSPELQAG